MFGQSGLCCHRRVARVSSYIYTGQCSGSGHHSCSTPCHEPGICLGGGSSHTCSTWKVDKVSWWMEDAEGVAAVREVRSAQPFSLAFWYCLHLYSSSW